MINIKNIAVIFLSLAILGLQYRWWFGASSWLSNYQLAHNVAFLERTNKDDLARNRQISAEITDLKSGTLGIESQARVRLGLVKPGETFFFFKPKVNQNTDLHEARFVINKP